MRSDDEKQQITHANLNDDDDDDDDDDELETLYGNCSRLCLLFYLLYA
jgi:hypothetical protein